MKGDLMKIRTLSLGAFAVLALAACGSDDDAASPAASSSPASTPAAEGGTSAQFNDADVTFAQSMIPHHEQAIEMADIALDPTVGAGAEVIDLATRIKAGQDPEIAQMTGWLEAWGQPVQMDMSEGHDMSSMEGMMSAEEMDQMGGMTGAEFDKMWMEMMIRHHEGAVAMAQTVKASGSNPDVLSLADAVIAAQQGEIAEMQALLGS
jgi:uncharacterized protein (DUF305 family)